jgi:hypothetical protein
MASSILRLLSKTLKRGTNLVRRVGKAARSTVKRGTNAVGLTKRSKSKRRRSHRSRKH